MVQTTWICPIAILFLYLPKWTALIWLLNSLMNDITLLILKPFDSKISTKASMIMSLNCQHGAWISYFATCQMNHKQNLNTIGTNSKKVISFVHVPATGQHKQDQDVPKLPNILLSLYSSDFQCKYDNLKFHWTHCVLTTAEDHYGFLLTGLWNDIVKRHLA